jgi:hypothetical protein
MLRKCKPSRACKPLPKTKKFKVLWKTFRKQFVLAVAISEIAVHFPDVGLGHFS